MREFDDTIADSSLMMPGGTRVIIAGDHSDTIDQVALLLRESVAPVEVLASCGTRECVELARDRGPDAVVLVDMESRVDALGIARSIYEELPGIATIVLAEPGQTEDPSYVRRAARSKASDVLPLPPHLDALTRSISEAVRLEMMRRPISEVRRGPRQLVVVYSPKGGVGKSVVAANLAAQLSKDNPELSIALVDLDLRFGDQAVLLDLDRSRSVLDLLSVIDELTVDAIRNALTTHPSGLRVLLPPPEPQQADLVREVHVRQILLAMKRFHDLVIVDTTSALSDVTLAALELADRILQICTPDVLSVWKTRSSLELWEALGISQDTVWLVFNRTSERSEVQPEQIRSLFSNRVVGDIPADFFSIQPYVNTGIPLVDAPKGGRVLESLRMIAREIIPAEARVPAQTRLRA